MIVKPKKHLGQHFLTDTNIAEKIAGILDDFPVDQIIEVGPGTGMMTQFLMPKYGGRLRLAEIDTDSISYLKTERGFVNEDFIGDFLAYDFQFAKDGSVGIIGNFPYNISSQILFKIIDHYDKIPVAGGMFQKEVAERIAAGPRTKSYGILSVLLQCFYDIEYLFTVPEHVFNPPPKVKSGVVRLVRSIKPGAEDHYDLLKKLVKAGFNQRRKKLSNALKVLGIPPSLAEHPFLDQRAEELSINDFIQFAKDWKNAS